MFILPTLFAVFWSAFWSRVALEWRTSPSATSSTSFYEKVVKVKADVAAILKVFLPIAQIEADHRDAAPMVPIGGMRKGSFSGAL